jgi:predicted PurR-regulated permease PerM
MEKFFEKLSEMMTFENQVYLMVAVLFILLVLCFIMLLVVGIKYKKLNSLVEKMTDGSDDAEDVPETISEGLENAGEAAAEEETDDSGTKEAAASSMNSEEPFTQHLTSDRASHAGFTSLGILSFFRLK